MVLWIIWFALTSSIFIYFVVMQISGTEPSESGENAMLVKILGGISVANILASIAIRKRQTLPAAKDGVTMINFQKVMASYIFSWALAESVAIF